MQLTKPTLDIGLYTNRSQAQLGFWQGEVGLEFDHLGKLGAGCISCVITATARSSR